MARWSRTDTALASAVCDMWAAGISTRKVEAVASDLGLESMSRSRVSRLCEGLDGEGLRDAGADLSSGEWPYLWLDATYVPCRERRARRGRWRSSPRWRARRRPAGASSASSASTPSPTCRGAPSCCRSGPAASPACASSPPTPHEGLVRAVREALPGAAWQRCIAHLERNVLERWPQEGRRVGGRRGRSRPPSPRADPSARGAPATAVPSSSSPPSTRAGRSCSRTPPRRRSPTSRSAGAPPLGVRTNQRLRAHELRDQEAHEGGAGVPVGGVAGEAGRGVCALDRNDAWACERNFIDRRSLEPGLRARAPARGARRRGEGPQARRGGVRQEEEGGVGYGARLRPRGTAVHHFS